MTDIKLVTIDIDNTLINSNMEIPQANIETIKEASSKGVHVVLVTGRSSSSIRKYMEILGLKNVIPSLGGCMFETFDGKILQDNTINKEDSLKINSIIRSFGQYPIVFKHDKWVSDPANTEGIATEIRATGVQGIYLDVSEYLEENRPNKMIIHSDNLPMLANIRKEIEEKCSDQVMCITSSNNYLEMMPKGVTKALSVNNLIEYYGITKDNVLAIGDYYNDLEMLKAAGHPTVVANAPDDLKQIVEYVSPLDNNHAAVSQIIKHYIG